jgi:imidazolonepropionase-like amidohydrolase
MARLLSCCRWIVDFVRLATARGGVAAVLEGSMRGQTLVRTIVGGIVAAAVLVASAAVVWTQGRGGRGQSPYYNEFLVPPDQVVAIRAGRLFDSRAGTMLTNQVILIKGDRIADIGANLAIPAGAAVIDLGNASVMPGLVDAHVHIYGPGTNQHLRAIAAIANAHKTLRAGFTTVLDMDSRGGYGTVDLRNEINRGVIDGPRMQVVGQSLNQRASSAYEASSPTFSDSFTENKNINSPWLARAAVRESKFHGTDWVKIYTTQDFVGEEYHAWKPDGTLVNSPSLTLEEVQAVVDEAHRLGLKVACHTYGGEGQRSCLQAGVDAPNHLSDLDDESLKILVQKKLPFVLTIDDLITLEPGDLRATGGKNSRLKMAEQSMKKAVAAGVPIVFGSGATGAGIPHGKQGDQFAYLVKWGLTPVKALQTSYVAAANMLNYNWSDRVGSIEKGKYADIIAVPGNPLTDITEMERVRFVMKGGRVVRNDITQPPVTSSAAAVR